MKLYFYFLTITIISIIKAQQQNCKEIKPNSASDCKLSPLDKERYFIYCCYKSDEFGKDCFAFDKEDYRIVQNLNKEHYYGDNIDFQCNSSSFIKLGLLLFILCFI